MNPVLASLDVSIIAIRTKINDEPVLRSIDLTSFLYLFLQGHSVSHVSSTSISCRIAALKTLGLSFQDRPSRPLTARKVALSDERYMRWLAFEAGAE